MGTVQKFEIILGSAVQPSVSAGDLQLASRRQGFNMLSPASKAGLASRRAKFIIDTGTRETRSLRAKELQLVKGHERDREEVKIEDQRDCSGKRRLYRQGLTRCQEAELQIQMKSLCNG